MSVLAASSYPLLNVFWSIFEFFLWVIWIWILIWVFIDIFRSHDLSGWAKALWFLFVLFIPLIGVLVYLIVRGGSMHERAQQQARQQDREFRAYVQEAAGSQSTADQLTKLADLRDRGVISAEEFEREKAKILAPEHVRAFGGVSAGRATRVSRNCWIGRSWTVSSGLGAAPAGGRAYEEEHACSPGDRCRNTDTAAACGKDRDGNKRAFGSAALMKQPTLGRRRP